jgi:hypothetical protein
MRCTSHHGVQSQKGMQCTQDAGYMGGPNANAARLQDVAALMRVACQACSAQQTAQRCCFVLLVMHMHGSTPKCSLCRNAEMAINAGRSDACLPQPVCDLTSTACGAAAAKLHKHPAIEQPLQQAVRLTIASLARQAGTGWHGLSVLEAGGHTQAPVVQAGPRPSVGLSTSQAHPVRPGTAAGVTSLGPGRGPCGW